MSFKSQNKKSRILNILYEPKRKRHKSKTKHSITAGKVQMPSKCLVNMLIHHTHPSHPSNFQTKFVA